MGEHAFEVEYKPGEEIVFRFRPGKLHWLPQETRSHVYEARKEMLLALRTLIDRAIEHVEEKEKAPGEGRTKIDIQ